MLLEFILENLILSIAFGISFISLLYLAVDKFKKHKLLLSTSASKMAKGAKYSFIYRYNIFKKGYYHLPIEADDNKVYILREDITYNFKKNMTVSIFDGNINVQTVTLYNVKAVYKNELDMKS